MPRFLSLGSGSRGNATLIEAGDTRVLLDCGYSARELGARLRPRGIEPDSLSAILVTHEHGDHIRGVGALARRHRLPVWMTRGTWLASDCGELAGLHLFHAHGAPFTIGALRIQPVAVPHDAREPCQFVFSHGGRRLGILTDTGRITPRIVDAYADLDGLLLESNHCPRMLAEGPYPPALQRRVGGDLGHLNNRQAASLLTQIARESLRHLVIGHISEKNNHPDRVRETLLDTDPKLEQRLTLLRQDRASDWFELD